MEAEKLSKINFVKNVLAKKIIETHSDLTGHSSISVEVELSAQLDGFMSSILIVNLKTENQQGYTENHPIIVKLMKGSVDFRTTSKSYTQFSNEITIYMKLIPELKKVLLGANVTTINADDWIPKVYYADYGLYPELSNGYESILATQNLKDFGFRNGPRLELDEPHLRLMIKTIGEYHGVQYAMHIKNDPKLPELISQLIPLPFIEPDGSANIFSIIYKIAVDRFFKYYDQSPQHHAPEAFRNDVKQMREKYGSEPLKIMEKCRNVDPIFNVILHGDYNRNNILFKYDKETGNENPRTMRMIDFQEVRYASPACDLSFFMFFNMNPDLFDVLWDSLLDQYHDTIIDTIAQILHVDKSDKILADYSEQKFLEHFSKYAIYGVMVAFQFLPCMMAPEDECDKLATLFENDMKSQEFYDYGMIAGGEPPNIRATQVFQFASKKGYTKILYDD